MSCPIVSAPCGQVKGRLSNVPEVCDAKQVYAYLGIPFAKPPVGDLRFEPPEKNIPWEGVYDATKQPHSPAQNSVMMKPLIPFMILGKQYGYTLENENEDCLYLNVFSANPCKSANMPVMVWIYGGGFQMGGVDFYDPQVLCSLHDVVVVIPTYRVNAFGFLTLGRDTDYKGNMGLKDQILAMEWVRDNVREFGGNPENVTIFGESAGSISVGCHMVSPISRGLFHKSIHHSGTANFPSLVNNDYPEYRKTFLELLKITETEPEAIMKKLKSFTTKEILDAQQEGAKTMKFFSVAVDGEILPENPKTLVEKKAFSKVPSIVGCNNTEGAGIFIVSLPGVKEGLNEELVKSIIKGNIAAMVEEEKLEKNVQDIVDFYSRNIDNDDVMKWNKIQGKVMGDLWFVVPGLEQALVHSELSDGNTYFYLLAQQTQSHHQENKSKKPDLCEGDHGDDVYYTFGFPFYNGPMSLDNIKFTDAEKELSRKWMTYLVNFAKTGNPNKGEQVDLEWPNYEGKNKHSLLAKIPMSIDENLDEDEVKFWKKILSTSKISCPVVNAPCGQVKGRLSNVPEVSDAKQVYAYLGIPFAKPPVGDLRFEPPQKNTPWDGIFDATKQPISPAQSSTMMEPLKDLFLLGNQYGSPIESTNEDCLYLNVFSSNPSKSANMPVMMWIYGGAFQIGGVDFYDPQVLCSLHDVVVVMPNYRVNAFGFLTLGRDTNYKGNMGLKDQILAMEWVRDNIQEFGGNPENVTIFGESAGSISVSCHMVSPMSRGLFHKSIHHSGTINTGLVQSDYPEYRKTFLELLKITETEPEAIIKKLKSFSTEEILQAQEEEAKNMRYFGVAVDGEIIPDEPNKLVEKRAFSKVPSIVGCNNTEGAGMFVMGLPGAKNGLEEEFVKSMIKTSIADRFKEKNLDKCVQAVIDFYLNNIEKDDSMKWNKIQGNVMGDSYFVVPSVEQALVHSEISNENTYVYLLAQQTQFHHQENKSKKPDLCEGDHGDDVHYTFGFPFYNGPMSLDVEFTNEEKELSRKWMTYLVNFATTGNPNKGEKVDVEWPNYEGKNKRNLLAKIPFTIDENLGEVEVKFWKEALPAL